MSSYIGQISTLTFFKLLIVVVQLHFEPFVRGTSFSSLKDKYQCGHKENACYLHIILKLLSSIADMVSCILYSV